MKSTIQHSINQIRTIAGVTIGIPNIKVTEKQKRPDNILSRSIRTEKEALQFKSELKAAVVLGKAQ